jgi:lysophospholipase L1-like esterase
VWSLLVLVVAATVVSADSRASSPATHGRLLARTSASLARVTRLTALGDSVPYGTACDCSPYPQLVGDDLARATGARVTSANDSVPGARSGDVLEQLHADAKVMSDVEASDAVMIEVGANDIAFTSSCGVDASCYEADLHQDDANIAAIVSRVETLKGGRHVAVILLDYWSVWLGGQSARDHGDAYEAAAASLTERLSEGIRAIAARTRALYVDVLTAFRGPDEDWDETHLLAPDGDHPNAAGHARIAQAIARVIA